MHVKIEKVARHASHGFQKLCGRARARSDALGFISVLASAIHFSINMIGLRYQNGRI
jgi:hypothetical protein